MLSSRLRVQAAAKVHRTGYQQWTTRLASNKVSHIKAGHISVGPDEGLLFFTQLIAFRLSWLANLVSRVRGSSEKGAEERQSEELLVVHPTRIIEEAVSKNPKLGNVKIVAVLPRMNEGGAFVKFKHEPTSDPLSIAETIQTHLKRTPVRPWCKPWCRVSTRPVLGKPWLEDLFRLPSQRLKVEFLPVQPGLEPAELSQEQLYSFFRPYGKLVDITRQPSDSKVVPRYAHVDFARRPTSVMAKNCLHGYTVDQDEGGGSNGTLLRLTYQQQQKFGWIKEWMFSHPRIVVPLLAALVAGISIAIFDPLRTLAVKAHITRAFHVEDNVVYKWFQRQSKILINRVKLLQRYRHAEPGMSAVWEERKDEIEQIQAWLMETADTFIVVTGPRGSGKRDLVVDHALQHKRGAHRLLFLDCKPIQEARGDTPTIAATAAQVGYRPVFSWVNNVSGMLDMAAQGVTGVKAGFSETLENQLDKIFNNTSAALRSVAIDSRSKNDPDRDTSDDEYLEAHPEKRPTVVIDNFLHRNNEPGASMVYEKLAEWAAGLVTSNVAHVVFLTSDVAFTKSLGKALPGRVFRQITLGDCSHDVAKRFVIKQLNSNPDEESINSKPDGESSAMKDSEDDGQDAKSDGRSSQMSELDEVVGQLGGRLTDLAFLARRIKAGESPTKAVNQIIDQSASEILKMFLLAPVAERGWTQQQAWTLIKSLAKDDALRYNELLLNAAFSGSAGEKAIAALEQSELVSVQSDNGRPCSIKAGKPVYTPAFRRLLDDKVLAAKMDLAMVGEATGKVSKAIDQHEVELKLLAELPKQPPEVFGRIRWLLNNIRDGQEKIEKLEKQSSELKMILSSEF